MTEYQRPSVDEPPLYDVPPPPAEGDQGPLPVDVQPGPPPPSPSFAPPPAQPQFLGYGQQGEPIYGYPVRPPMNPMVKTAIAVGAGIGLAVLMQMVSDRKK